MMLIKEFLKAEALRLGFDLIGVTSPAPPLGYGRFADWIAAGRQAGMAYLGTDRSHLLRANPALVLEGCKTILVVAMRYPAPPAGLQTQRGFGRIAAYAWDTDYHLNLPPLLESLAEHLQVFLGRTFNYKCYTDTGPILEKELAQRAGLGWIGKNSCLINPKHGSYFLLGELFLDLEIDPDPPFEADRCGSCRRCLDACPTGCILPDRTLDAGRCIAYLTIENKGPIPTELRPAVGDWVFGCDICQMVCPWNARFTVPTQEIPEHAQLATRQILDMSAQAYNQKFKYSPLLRARRKGLVRSSAIVAGNQRDAAAQDELMNVLKSDEAPAARSSAA